MFVIIALSVVGVWLSDDNINETSKVTNNTDWGVQIGNNQIIEARPGQLLEMPIKLSGNVQDSELAIYVTELHPRFGAIYTDVNNPKFPEGISMNLSVSKINMHEIPTDLKLSILIDENVKSGTYDFGIHMIYA